MNYEQKYKEALSWMQSLYKGLHGATKEDAEHYFPELKKSEDEKMKNIAIKAVNAPEAQSCIKSWGVNPDDVIAWLKKQGEQKPIDESKPKFKVGDRVNQNDREDKEYNILTITSVDIDEHCYICHQESVIDFEEQDLWHIVEQKNSWSKEDEKMLNEFIESLRYCNGNGYNKQIDWLKSLKDRIQPQQQEWSEEDDYVYKEH